MKKLFALLSSKRRFLPHTALLAALFAAGCLHVTAQNPPPPPAAQPPPAATASAQTAPPAPAANLIANGGFESPLVVGTHLAEPGGDKWMWADQMPPWQSTQPHFEIWESGYRPPNADVTAHFGPCQSAEGTQNLEIIADAEYSAAVWQNVPTTPGQHYTLSFYHSPRPGAHSRLTVWADSTILGRFDEDGSTLTNFNWWKSSVTFAAIARTTTIKFADETETLGQGTHLDGVELDKAAANSPVVSGLPPQPLSADSPAPFRSNGHPWPVAVVRTPNMPSPGQGQ
jgi:hypothetical protein